MRFCLALLGLLLLVAVPWCVETKHYGLGAIALILLMLIVFKAATVLDKARNR